MPDNQVEDRLRNLFELENISQSQILSQSAGSNWPVLNHSHWVGRQGQFAAPLDFNPQYPSERQLDSVKVPCDQSFVELTPRAQNFRSNSRNRLNTDERLLDCQNFQTKQNQPAIEGEITGYVHHNLSSRGSSVFQSQQATECVDSPTLTTNSGRSEITEVSTDFNFLRGQQPERAQQPGSPQSRIMQQSAYSDMQLLQQHVMFKQLQELQQQQQLQQLGDMRQQNSLNQLSAFAKQTAGGQFPPLINGTPVHDTSQVFRNWVQRGASPGGQGIPSRVMLSQEQGQALHSMGVVSQLHDISLFGTPIANARGNLSQYSHLQELSNDSVNLMAGASGQIQKPTMQSSSFNNPFLGDQRVVSGEQVGMLQGAFIPKQVSQGRNIYGQIPVHGLNTGGFSGNPQEGNMLQTSASLKEFSGKQEQVGWPSMQQTTKQLGPSQGFVPLDPMEEKILYNMDDNVWDASFGRRSHMDTGFSGNSLEHTVPSNTFPSIQSGSWSALMQSAVAESSSSDTGPQEEWSGLTFQNTEQSNDNLLPNFMDSEKQQTGWVDSNLQNTSFNSKPFPMFNDGNINSSFPGFQQAAVQFSVEGREGVRQDSSHEAIEYCNPQQKSPIEENQRVQSFMHLDNTLAGQMYMHSESNAQNQRIVSQNNVSQPCGNGAINPGIFPDGFLWKGDRNGGASSFSRSIGETEQVQSGADRSPPNIENSQTPNFSAATNSSIFKAHLPTNQYIPDSNQTGYKEQITVSVDNNGNERVGKIQQVSNSPLVPHNYYGGANATYDKQQNCYQKENSNNCYTSKELIGHGQGHFGQFKSIRDVSSSSNLDKGCLPDLQRNSKSQEVATSRGDHIPTFHSQNMLELLHKVDQSRDESSLVNFGSSDCTPSSQGPKAEMPDASSSQLYTQSSSSQGFGLRLASPSQQSLNSKILSPQSSWKAGGNLNSEQVSSEFGVKSPTWSSPQSAVQSMPTLHKLRQEAHYDSQFGGPGHTGNSSILNMQRGSNASATPSPPYLKNQLQMHFMSNIPAAPQSLQGILPSSANRYPQFNRVPSPDTSQQMFPNPLSQQIPVLGNVPVSQPSIVSGISQQGEISAGPDNLWKNVPPQQQPLDVKSLEVSSNLTSSLDQSNNGILSTLAPQGSTDHNSEKGENYDASSVKTQGFAREDEQAAKERFLQQTSIEMPDASKKSGGLFLGQEPVEKLMSGAAGLASGSLVGYSRLHQPDRIRNNDNPPDSIQSGDSKMLNFLRGARESLTVRALQQPAVRDIYCPQTDVVGPNISQDQSGSSNAVSNNTDRGQIDLRMAPSWFKQYGTLRNGQMVPMYEARVGKTAVGQLSLGKSSQHLHSHPSMEHLDGTDASHGGRVWPRTAATLVPDKHLLAPYVLPSDAASQNIATMRQKKRKIAPIEPLPWHKEVIEGNRGLQTICMAEQEWAKATNRLIEKVQYEVEMTEDVHQSLRSKRRLIMTTQVMHQLFRPAPVTLMLADVASHYESASYFVSKLAVGDACSLANCARNSLLVPVDDDNMEKVKDTKKCSDQQFSEFVEELIGRANKLENEFQRLDKSASVVDLRVECQDLERFAVINRFAKFHSHSRAQVDTSGASFPSGAPRSFPQRYVAALPMPRNIPEGVQCLSL
ncbi:uncharacterized protein LOC119997238 isoform X2 [Tripterygium wilfordii]|uniref:uncharacterized protein LOC119997238 isoform X2 n=1 Tax=Tripterygium wilfordii TaxID=458696 RepID=UPI0018F7E616|nr:uncharacterized protein LOC119997238 isoform X2 [Tripterygium wilfordii]